MGKKSPPGGPVRVVGGEPVPLRVHHLRLTFTDAEWEALQLDALEVGVTEDQLLGLVAAFAIRARICHAAGLALADILPYRRETVLR